MPLTITNDNFQAGNAIVASEINTNFTEIENYINNSMPSLGTAATFTALMTFNAGVTSTGGTTTLGTTTATTLTTSGAGASDNNVQITFAEGYAIHADNAGSGSDSSRLWFEAPNEGEIILGPRGGGSFLNRLRLRATTTLIEGAVDLNGDLDVSGTANLDAVDIDGAVNIGANLTFAGSVTGANPITKVAYRSTTGAATEASNTINNPVIYICTADPTEASNGDIWIQR